MITKEKHAGRLFAVRFFSSIAGKWHRHQATGKGLKWADADAMVKGFKELQADIVPFSEEYPNKPIDWLNIPENKGAFRPNRAARRKGLKQGWREAKQGKLAMAA